MPSPKKPGKKKASTQRNGKSKPAPKKRAASGGKTSRTSSAKKRTKAASRAPRKRARARKTQPAPPRRTGVWLAGEVATLVLGLILGLSVGAVVQYRRAVADVQHWLDHPIQSTPGVIWSAPLTVVPGQPYDAQSLASDLLAAGYEHVPGAPEPRQYDDDAGFEVHAATGERVTITFDDARVLSVEPSALQVGPVPLAIIGDMETARTPIELDALSPWVAPAVLSMEDARFYRHFGVDPLGVARAILAGASGTGPMQGGSTLTQQLAKNVFLTQERTARRKVTEVFYAVALERMLGKRALLELYLGEVYLGQVGGIPVHGVEQGARTFFGVSAESLTAGQAAALAGIISSPNTWSPHRHPERAQERRDLALGRMVDEGHLEPSVAEAHRTEPLTTGGTMVAANRRAPWAVDMAVDLLEDALDGGVAAGYQVHTEIDPALQRLAERSVRDGLAAVEASYPDAEGAQAALVAVRVRDGAITALVGSRNYAESPFNRASNAYRQIGSTAKPLVLAAAFDADPRLTPLTVVLDEPITRRVDGTAWTPANYDHQFVGEITLRRALEGSRNIPAVKVAETLGISGVQRHLRQVGLSQATLLPSASLGAFPGTPVQVAGAYTVFPGGGTHTTPRLLDHIEDVDGNTVITYEPEHTDVLSAQSAALTTSILEGVISDGTGARARRFDIRGPMAGKTGTTDAYRDAWFVGFTPDHVVAVWVGTDRGEGIGLSGSRAAIPVWGRFVQGIDMPGASFPEPAGMSRVRICADSERVARDACPNTYTERLRDGTEPDERCDEHGGPLVEVGGFLQRLFRGLGRKQPRDLDPATP